LSIIGSSTICFIMMRDYKRKLIRPKNRLLFGLSGFDVIQSFAMVISSAAIPRDSKFYGAIGNYATCTAQGFCMTLGLAVPLYSCSLNLCYLLSVIYSIPLDQISTNIELMLHLVSIIVPSSAAIFFAAQGSMQPNGNICLIASKEAILFTAFIISFSVLFCVLSTAMIWHYLNFQIMQSLTMLMEIREKRVQALLYTSAFIATYMFPFIRGFFRLFLNSTFNLHAFNILTAIFYPLQGFWNFFFFIRPFVNILIEANPNRSVIGAIKEAVFDSSCTEEIHFIGIPMIEMVRERSIEEIKSENKSGGSVGSNSRSDGDNEANSGLSRWNDVSWESRPTNPSSSSLVSGGVSDYGKLEVNSELHSGGSFGLSSRSDNNDEANSELSGWNDVSWESRPSNTSSSSLVSGGVSEYGKLSTTEN